MTKHPTSFRLSEPTLTRLAKLAERWETTLTAALERAVRDAATREGVK